MSTLEIGFGGLPPYQPVGSANKWDELRDFIDRLPIDKKNSKFKDQVWGWFIVSDKIESNRAVTTCHSYKNKKGAEQGWKLQTRTDDTVNGRVKVWVRKVQQN